MKDKFYILFGIDMETDVGSFTPFYEGVKNGTPLLLELFDKKDIAGTFYFTGSCARENPKIVETVRNSVNEVGCHSLFHETVGDQLFPIPGEKPLLPEEVPFRIQKATEWVEEVLGYRPEAFRCPRLWGSTAVVNALEALGYKTDASYPMYYYRERLVPYHPSKEDWTKEGELDLLEIPNFADMAMQSKDPGLERDRDQWPLFRTKGAGVLMKHIHNYMDFVSQRNLQATLCFYFHPWEFIPCMRTYRYGEAAVTPQRFITKGCGKNAVKELSSLIDSLKELGGEFVSAKDLREVYSAK